MAGSPRDVNGIHPGSMRILGKHALVFIHSGKGIYSDSKGLEQPFNAGDVIQIFPKLAHAYGPDITGEWEQIYVVFHGPQFELLEGANILSPDKPIWSLGPADYWKRRLKALFHTAPPLNDFDALRTVSRFANLIADMAATQAEGERPPSEAWLHKSMQLLAEAAAEGWPTPQEAAQQVGLSYENFRKRFTKHVGESPGTFQKRRRIEHACAMIYQNTSSFKELADDLGFCDVFHFSKALSKIMGESPSAYRKRVNGA